MQAGSGQHIYNPISSLNSIIIDTNEVRAQAAGSENSYAQEFATTLIHEALHMLENNYGELDEYGVPAGIDPEESAIEAIAKDIFEALGLELDEDENEGEDCGDD